MSNSCIPPTIPAVPVSIPLIPASIPSHSRVPRARICLSLRSRLCLSDLSGAWRSDPAQGSPSFTVPSTAAQPGVFVLSLPNFSPWHKSAPRKPLPAAPLGTQPGFCSPNLCWTPGQNPHFPVPLLTPHLQLQQSSGSSWMKEEELLAAREGSGFGKGKSGECERGFVSCSCSFLLKLKME